MMAKKKQKKDDEDVGPISMALGKLKVWQTRLGTYISLINFIMIFYLYIIASPLGWEWHEWAILITAGIVFIVVFDTTVVYPASLDYSFKKNPEWNKLKKKVRGNSKKLDEILTILRERN